LGYSVDVGDDAYPAEIERDVTLAGGGQIHVRPIRPDDAPRLQALHSRLSRDSIFFRFFSPLPALSDARAAYFTAVDYQTRMAIVALDRPTDQPAAEEQIIGVCRYDLLNDTRAEIALIVEDRFQHLGVGSTLFSALIEVAQERGITVFVANVLPENARMLRLLQESGYPLRRRRSRDYLAIEIDLTTPPA
jgi:RimJ/RimL family protein N-acetyltransferase